MKIIQCFTTSTITQPLIPVSRIRPAAYKTNPKLTFGRAVAILFCWLINTFPKYKRGLEASNDEKISRQRPVKELIRQLHLYLNSFDAAGFPWNYSVVYKKLWLRMKRTQEV